MCENCFVNEIESFENKETWTSFDIELTRKVGQKKIKHLKFVVDRQRDKDDGEDIYECLTCRQSWRLRNHYENGDGYFMKLTTLGKFMTLLTEKQKLILGLLTVLLLILINIFYWLWTH